VQGSNPIESVSIIGTGNVAWHISRALFQNGINIKHIISRSQKSAEELASAVNALGLSAISQINELSDIYLLCVVDDAIEEISTLLEVRNAAIVHCSGSVNLEILKKYHTNCGVFYPLQTFSKGLEMDYQEIPFLLEASNSQLMSQLEKMANSISGLSQEADSEMRLKMHIAAVFACNFSNHMNTIAWQLLQDIGLEYSFLGPLLKQTYRKLESTPPLLAQTGPAVREDLDTLEKHINALELRKEEQEIYKLITENIIKYSKRK
jgi:predicted short-subunit dehydrogenase-like oxidoreductase (DUF2520 family)